MDTLITVNAGLAGFFACAAIHYAVHWWFSRHERVLLVFSAQCAVYTVFSLAISSFFRARTVPDAQSALDWLMTVAMLSHALLLQFYADLGGRHDRAFRALVTGVLAFLAVLNQWAPLRGTVLELRTMPLPWGGGTGLLAIRTPPGVSLAVLYLLVLAIQSYGLIVARAIWKRDRAGAVLVAIGAAAILAGFASGFLVDFAKVRTPYAGAFPHAINVLCVAFFLSREYSARGARVAATERQFEAAFDHSPIGKALFAMDGRFLRVNRAFCHILGSTVEEIFARRLYDIFRDDDGSIEAESRRLLGGEVRPYTVEKRLVRKEGDPVWALLVVSVVPNDRGQPVQMIAHVEDVTELRAHRERLEDLVATRTRELRDAKEDADRANAAKSEFLAHISHEIRTPLGVIMLYAQLLQRDRALDESQRKKTDIILSSGKHLRTLLDDVLEMSKIEARRTEIAEVRFDPWATLDEVEPMFAVQCASSGIELTMVRSPELPHSLLGDRGKVKQILINLVSNAVKFTEQGAIRLEASARPLAEESILVEIVVADTGIGIAAADLERLFQPFEQLKAGARAGGTGLGLAISLSHARLMGGDLTVRSVPGAGSTFTFTFLAKPLGPEPVVEGREAPPVVAMDGTRCKVLIVDDLDHIRDALAELLSRPGFETRTAADGPSALAIQADWSPDLVLMDVRMPEMDGLEAIRRMRAAGSNAAIGVLSASALADDEREALAIGADFFMRKPYDARELFERISRVIAAGGR